MIEIVESAGGVSLWVRVTPRAKHASVGGEHDAALKVAVTQPADQGKANDAVIQAIADYFGIRRADVEILSGHSARRKRLHLRCADPATIRNRLEL